MWHEVSEYLNDVMDPQAFSLKFYSVSSRYWFYKENYTDNSEDFLVPVGCREIINYVCRPKFGSDFQFLVRRRGSDNSRTQRNSKLKPEAIYDGWAI